MKRKFYRVIGEIRNGQYGLFGRINGQNVSLKEITDSKTGEQKWLVNETIEVWESDKVNDTKNETDVPY